MSLPKDLKALIESSIQKAKLVQVQVQEGIRGHKALKGKDLLGRAVKKNLVEGEKAREVEEARKVKRYLAKDIKAKGKSA